MPVLGDVRFNNYAQLNLFFKVKDPSRLYDCPVRYVPVSPYPMIIKSVLAHQYDSSIPHKICGKDYQDHIAEITFVDAGAQFNGQQCLYFDGNYMYAQTPRPYTYSIGSPSAYTISMWISCQDYIETSNILYAGTLDSEAATGNMKLFIKDGYLFFSVLEVTSSAKLVWHTRCWDAHLISSSGPPSLTHLAIVREASKYPKLYIGGIERTDFSTHTASLPKDYHICHGEPTTDYPSSTFNIRSSCDRIVVGGSVYYYRTYSDIVIIDPFKGWLKDVCIRSNAYWTTTFTPPTKSPDINETVSSKKVVKFLLTCSSGHDMNNEPSVRESVQSIYMEHPVFASTRKAMTNGKYSIYIPNDMTMGFMAEDLDICWSDMSRTDDGVTVECTAYAVAQGTASSGGTKTFLSYETIGGTDNDVLQFQIERYDSTKNFPRSDYYYDACIRFVFCSATLSVTDQTCVGKYNNYCISYDAYSKKAYCYVNNLYVGSIARTRDSVTRQVQRFSVGFNSKSSQNRNSFGGYVGQVKVYSCYCKYNKTEDLVNVLSNCETWMILYNVQAGTKIQTYAIELTYESTATTRANLLKIYDTHNYLRVLLQTTNGNLKLYWAPMVSYFAARKGIWHPFYSKFKVIHPNGNRGMIMGCPSQKIKPASFLKNDFDHINAQQQWCTVRRNTDEFQYVYDKYDNTDANGNPLYCYAPRFGTSSSFYCKFGQYSFDMSKNVKIVCDHTDIFNFEESWTIDFFFFLTINSTSKTVKTPIVDLFGAIGIAPDGIYYYDGTYDASDNYHYDNGTAWWTIQSTLTTQTWHYIAVRYIQASQAFQIYIDGNYLVNGYNGNSSYGRIDSSSKRYVLTAAGLQKLVRYNNEIVIGRQNMDCYLDSFRIRRIGTGTITEPTEVSTTSSISTDFVYLNFDDLKI